MLNGPNHMRNLEFRIVDDTRQMIQTSPIRPLDDMIGFASPIENDIIANQVVKLALAFARHFQADDGGPTFGLKSFGLIVRSCHPATIVNEWLLGFFGRFPQRLHLLRPGIIAISMSESQQTGDGRSVVNQPLRLKIRSMRSTHSGAFIPIEPQPAKAI